MAALAVETRAGDFEANGKTPRTTSRKQRV